MKTEKQTMNVLEYSISCLKYVPPSHGWHEKALHMLTHSAGHRCTHSWSGDVCHLEEGDKQTGSIHRAMPCVPNKAWGPEDATWPGPEGRRPQGGWYQEDNACEGDEGVSEVRRGKRTHARERSNVCKGFQLKNTGPPLGNCGCTKKNISMSERRESCLHLIIFQLRHEVSRQCSSSWTSALNVINVSASPALE